MRTAWVLLLALVTAPGCGSPTSSNPEPQPPQIPITELRSAPETLVVSDAPVTVAVYLSRDFMPTVPPTPEGSPLGAGVQLRAPGRNDLPTLVGAAYIWVLNGDAVWSKVLRRVDYGSQPDQLDWVAGDGGPRWGPDVFVDVVVGAKDREGGLSLGITRHVLIRRTE
jgi:hypothetical protein